MIPIHEDNVYLPDRKHNTVLSQMVFDLYNGSKEIHLINFYPFFSVSNLALLAYTVL
jgi:hypothetical protein